MMEMPEELRVETAQLMDAKLRALRTAESCEAHARWNVRACVWSERCDGCALKQIAALARVR